MPLKWNFYCHKILNVNASIRILAKYFIALDLTKKFSTSFYRFSMEEKFFNNLLKKARDIFCGRRENFVEHMVLFNVKCLMSLCIVLIKCIMTWQFCNYNCCSYYLGSKTNSVAANSFSSSANNSSSGETRTKRCVATERIMVCGKSWKPWSLRWRVQFFTQLSSSNFPSRPRKLTCAVSLNASFCDADWSCPAPTTRAYLFNNGERK